MARNQTQLLVRALLKARCVTIRSARNIKLAVSAVDFGLCRFTQRSDAHQVYDSNWKVHFGIEVTDRGNKLASA